MKLNKTYLFGDTFVGFFDNVAYFAPNKENAKKEIDIIKVKENDRLGVFNLIENKPVECPNLEQNMFALLNFLSYDNYKNPRKQGYYHLNPADLFSCFMGDMREIWYERAKNSSKIAEKWCLPNKEENACSNALVAIALQMKREKGLEEEKTL